MTPSQLFNMFTMHSASECASYTMRALLQCAHFVTSSLTEWLVLLCLASTSQTSQATLVHLTDTCA
eukprot:scaffold167381_cov32-Tisochrysis_lutea.AAC.1